MPKFKQIAVGSTQYSATLYGLDEAGVAMVCVRYWESKSDGSRYRYVPTQDTENYHLKAEWVPLEKEHEFIDTLTANQPDAPRVVENPKKDGS